MLNNDKKEIIEILNSILAAKRKIGQFRQEFTLNRFKPQTNSNVPFALVSGFLPIVSWYIVLSLLKKLMKIIIREI